MKKTSKGVIFFLSTVLLISSCWLIKANVVKANDQGTEIFIPGNIYNEGDKVSNVNLKKHDVLMKGSIVYDENIPNSEVIQSQNLYVVDIANDGTVTSDLVRMIDLNTSKGVFDNEINEKRIYGEYNVNSIPVSELPVPEWERSIFIGYSQAPDSDVLDLLPTSNGDAIPKYYAIVHDISILSFLDATISGTVGTPINPQSFVMVLRGDTAHWKDGYYYQDDVNELKQKLNIPNGLNISALCVGDMLTVSVSGTPLEASENAIEFKSTDDIIKFHFDNAKWNIKPAETNTVVNTNQATPTNTKQTSFTKVKAVKTGDESNAAPILFLLCTSGVGITSILKRKSR